MAKKSKKDHDEAKEVEESFGAFEKHTKGIGMKLLLKMGFKPGQGLGKDSEGRAEPVKIKLRPKGVGIGFSDEEEEPEVELKRRNVDNLEVKAMETRTRIPHKVHKRDYTETFDIEEPSNTFIIEEHFDTSTIQESNGNVIDMTTDKGSGIPLSGLLQEISREKKRQRAALNFKQNEVESALRQLKRNIEEVERERRKLKEIERENELKLKLKSFSQWNFDDYSVFDELATFADFSDSELMKRTLSSILQGKIKIFEAVWMEKLDTILRQINCTEIYSQLIFHVWWPVWRKRAAAFSGPIEDPSTWQDLMENLRIWAHLLPNDFLISFLGNQIIFPRFRHLITSDYADADVVIQIWDFLKNDLGFPMDILKGDLVSWLSERIQIKPFEAIATEFTQIWEKRKLLSSSDLKRIKETAWKQRIQKLLQRDLIINPADQDLTPLNSALSAYQQGICSKSQIIQLLSNHLIPKLEKCVLTWLKEPQVDFEEVAEWYVAWKDLIPDELFINDENDENSSLLDGFGKILNVINENI